MDLVSFFFGPILAKKPAAEERSIENNHEDIRCPEQLKKRVIEQMRQGRSQATQVIKETTECLESSEADLELIFETEEEEEAA